MGAGSAVVVSTLSAVEGGRTREFVRTQQDPTDEQDLVCAAYFGLLSGDSSKDVRKFVLASMEVTKVTLPHLLERVRDVNDDVRRFAFKVIAEKVELKLLSIKQRAELVRHGLTDRTPAVKATCAELIASAWLEKAMGGDVLRLLDALDAEAYPDVAELVLASLVRNAKASKQLRALINVHELRAESAASLHALCQHYKSTRNESMLDEIMPDGAALTDLLERYAAQPAVALHLLRLIPLADLSDEAGRQRVHARLLAMLSESFVADEPDEKLQSRVVEETLRAMRPLYASEAAFVHAVLECVSPGTADPDAEEGVHCHVLLVVRHLILLATDTVLAAVTPTILPLVSRAVRSVSPLLRFAGLQCLAGLCATSEVIAKEHLLLIFNVLRNDTPPMQRLAIEAVFDIMLLFDTRGWRSFGDADAEAHELVRELVPSLQDADDGMRTLAVEGFAKLLYTNRIGEAEVLKQLIVLFFSPTTESDSRLRQCLGVFFPAYRPPQGARMHAHAHAHTHLWKTGRAGSARRVPIGGTVNSSHGRHATFAQVRAAL
jgi:hypothetical protein